MLKWFPRRLPSDNIEKAVARLNHAARHYDKLAEQALQIDQDVVRSSLLESEQCRNQARFYREISALLTAD